MLDSGRAWADSWWPCQDRAENTPLMNIRDQGLTRPRGSRFRNSELHVFMQKLRRASGCQTCPIMPLMKPRSFQERDKNT
jgi:hypothetical protein